MRTVARLVVVALAASMVSADGAAARVAAAAERQRPKSDPRLTVAGKPFAPEPRWQAASDRSDPAWATAPAVTPPRTGVADVAVPATGLARAGDLPVLVGVPASGGAPAKVAVTVHERAVAEAAGASYVLVSVTRADGVPEPARVRLAVDYAAFRNAFGGDFASRLRLVGLPACATTTPDLAGCGTPSAVAATNDLTAGRIAGDVVVPAAVAERRSSDSMSAPATAAALPSDGGTYALASTPSGPTGDYTATPLSSAAKWSVSKNTGGFSWSYPMPMPPAPAGKTPSLGLAYSSQSVDGRTAKANGQPSQVGEGFTFSPMFIERKFQSCTEDGHTEQDLCHQSPEYFLSWDGRSSELVRKPGTNEWRLRDDPGWRIRSLTGANNGDQFGDYWEVTTPDGTRNLFGYGREPVTNAVTNGAWTVPVFGDDAGEPCYSTTGVFAVSWCRRAWRWNLDRVLDRNDNVMSLFWVKETNYYARNGISNTPVQYDRGGFLRSINYGHRSTRENWAPPAYVRVDTTHRCAAQVGCTDDTLNTASNYPDVPLDLRCTSATSCPGIGQKAPSFWSTEKIVRVSTWVKTNATTDPAVATYSDVDEVELFYSFPDTNEDTTPSLFLTTIRRHGLVGTRLTLPDVHIGGTALSNRVDSNPSLGVPATNKYRVTSVEDELGTTTTVTYGQQNPCNAAVLPPNGGWNQNDTDCFPQYYDPDGPGGTPAGYGAFRKFLVTSVVADDTTLPAPHSPDRVVAYTYLGTPVWHYDNALQGSEGTNGAQSWSDFRGYESVREVAGDPASTSRSTTVYKAYRGMHGDKAGPTGGSKSVTLTDYEGLTYTDSDWLAGKPLETIRYSVAGAALERVVQDWWAVRQYVGAAAWQSHDVYFVRESRSSTYTRNTLPATDTWRRRRTVTTYDTTYAVRQSVLDMGDTAVTTDDTCTIPAYTHNTTDWIIGLPYVTRRYAGDCASPSTTPQIGRTETNYDGQAYMAAPAKGNVTTVKQLVDGVNAAITTTTYDPLGRVASTTAPNEYGKAATAQAKTTYTYSPASGFPYDGVTTRQAVVNGNDGIVKSTTTFSFAWGLPLTVTENAAFTTQVAYDGLGRIVSVQRPGDPAGVPGIVYEYDVSQDVPSRVRTRRLLEGTTSSNAVYVDGYQYLTSFGKPVETQSAAPGGGRIVAGTRYDDQGRAVAVSGPMQASDVPGANFVNYDPATSPSDTRTTYDALGRTTSTKLYGSGLLKATTTYDHGGWSTVAYPPVRSPITTSFDVFGRTTQVKETTPQSTDGYATTTYSYDRDGRLTGIEDDNAHTWSYSYDWLGRRTASSDPDQGASTTTYDANGNVVTTQDALTHAVWHKYDALNRRLETRETNATGRLLAAWTYDTATNGVGRLASATSYANPIPGASGTTWDPYTYTVTGYDGRGRVTGKRWTIPASAGALAGTYQYSYTYDHSDNVRTTTFPAAGGLPAETLTVGFDPRGWATTLTGDYGGTAVPYVAATTYDNVARLLSRDLGASGVTVDRDFTHDPATGRLTSAKATVAGAPSGNGVVDDLSFQYDAEGNVTRVGALQPDASPATTQYECFGYNWRDQLDRAFTTTDPTCVTPNKNGLSPYDYTYFYDNDTNLKTLTDNSGTSAVTHTYTYGPKLHGLDAIDGVNRFDHDANGAVTSRWNGTVTQTVRWNWLHQLDWTADGSDPRKTSFVYDADGARLMRRDGDSARTLFLEGQEVSASGSTVTATRYYGGHAVRTTGGTTPGLHWLVNNHQNSAGLTVAASDGAVLRRRYDPYGSPRPGAATLPTPRGFLNKVEDPTGLVATDARYLDAGVGQFVSPDPLLAPTDPRSLNPFLYSYGNPTSTTDPSGLAPIVEEGGTSGCENNSCTEEAHNIKYQVFLQYIAMGAPTPDHIIGGEKFSDQEREQLKWAYITSPCFGDDKSGCLGNKGLVFACQVHGNVRCAEWAEGARQRGEAASEMLVFMLQQNLGASMRMAGGTFIRDAGGGGGGTTRLYRAVERGELQDIESTGQYRLGPGNEGKYFFPTRAQAENFAKMMSKSRLGGPFCITSGCTDTRLLSQYERLNIAGEGPAWYLPEEMLPYITDIQILGPGG
ncbi:MAG TPA: RHS repeat-associated core domain-containing protein [Mycobacteriales bacterium]|jgi:RHS repeat-associated protein